MGYAYPRITLTLQPHMIEVPKRKKSIFRTQSRPWVTQEIIDWCHEMEMVVDFYRSFDGDNIIAQFKSDCEKMLFILRWKR